MYIIGNYNGLIKGYILGYYRIRFHDFFLVENYESFSKC